MQLVTLFGFPTVRTPNAEESRWPDHFGVELELENPSDVPPFRWWSAHDDGSLRNGVEFVTAQPMNGADLREALDEFYGRRMTYTNGPRTSTHIHINATDMTVDNLRSMFVAVYAIEDHIFDIVGESRKWGGYCMGLTEMPAQRMRRLLSAQNMQEVANNISPQRNQERYYGFNTCVRKHGTVEFRHFPGGPARVELENWLDLVQGLKNFSRAVSMQNILDMSEDGAQFLAVLNNFLTPYWRDEIARRDSGWTASKLQEVCALATPELDPSRNDQLVFVTDEVLAFTKNKFFNQEADAEIWKAFSERMKALRVVSLSDWITGLRSAQRDQLAQRNEESMPPLRPRLDTESMRATLERQRAHNMRRAAGSFDSAITGAGTSARFSAWEQVLNPTRR